MLVLARRVAPVLVLVIAASVLTTVGPASAAPQHGAATRISAGGYQACAITPSKRLKCWGNNSFGQLGIGSDATDQLTPVRVPGLENVKFVDVGDYETCAILRGGRLKCWGDNGSGAVGDGTTTERREPTQVKGLTSGVVGVSVGTYHTCARLKSGRVKCWGSNTYGQIGNGTVGNEYHEPELVKNIRNATQVSAGYEYSCATVNNRAKCWGLNDDGKLGDRTIQPRDKPTQVYGLTTGVKRVVAGYYTTCAILAHGRLKCWGENSFGEAGTGTSGNEYHRPVQVVGMTSGVTGVDPDYYFTCSTQNGKAKCWGDNALNQLGDGTTYDRYIPRRVSGLTSGVKQVNTSYYSGCALLTSGAAKCWGWNAEGEVGIGTATDQIPTPKRVHL